MPTELAEPQWRARRKAHEARVDEWVRPHLERRGRGISHPVDDFLFTYYSYRPAALRRWHPGVGVVLTGPDVDDFRAQRGYAVDHRGARVDTAVVQTRRDETAWIRDHLQATSARSPMLGCFGLHEWAMVYRQEPAGLRHAAYPLRLGTDGTDAVVESHRVTCTHFDAFRFFTAPARPLNVVAPTRATQRAHEQPGCLHAATDCYKWAYKLAPLTPSELVADCFALAREVRQVDMRAAPYDLSSLGLEPIRIETPPGKAAYVAYQRDFAARSTRLRARLIGICDLLLDASEHADA